jgi:V/A-type H+-transporting ATPase subunit A
MNATGKIVGVNGNMITVAFDGAVAQNEVGYAMLDGKRLMAEIVRVRGRRCDMQVFDATADLAVDDAVEFSGNLLAAELGPGMLAQVYDGLQNPLADLAREAGKISSDAQFFLQRGMYLPGLSRDRKWNWHPTAKPGERVAAGDFLGWVPEGIFDEKTMPGHKIMVPFALRGLYTVKDVAPAGDYTVTDDIATLVPVDGGAEVKVQMMQRWPVKVPITCFEERLEPSETLETTVRTIYSLTVKRQGNDVVLEVTGDGFLYNMVRIITGTLVEVGLGKRKPEELAAVIESCDRRNAGHTAPAEGLYLVEVFYDEMQVQAAREEGRACTDRR